MEDNIICCGDCRKCEPLVQGKANPAVCASKWGFVHIVGLWREMREMHTQITTLLEEIKTSLPNDKQTTFVMAESDLLGQIDTEMTEIDPAEESGL